MSAQQARTAYHLGRREEAARHAASLEDDFHKQFAARLQAPPPSVERHQLEVNFVRQHFKTCAPATLAALGRFWNLPAEHLKLAEAMCYDGTPHWQQRDWAAQNGWFVREFRVTHEAAIALLQRGIPFALSTVEATFAHMQALIGFDLTRGTLLLRDPGQPYTIEAAAAPFLERYRPFGPHGAVFLPESERGRLEGLTLPDAGPYDEHHLFQLALAKHDRAGAVAALYRLEALEPEHALTWEARLDLATYDANLTEQVRCLDRLLEFFPGCAARQLRRLGCLREAPREEQLGFLENACAAKDADPALFIELARLLGRDARRLPEARQRLKRALQFRGMDSNAINVLAGLLWEEDRKEEATELYRFAANLESYREHLYQNWFLACRQTRRTAEALAHLQDRFQRFGARSEQPALTLAWAWREMEQPARARDVLAEARHLRLEDARRIFEHALHHDPNNPQLHASLAHLLWRLRQPEPAFAALERALHLAPGFEPKNGLKDIRHSFRRAGRTFAREGAGWRARLWFGWKLHWPWALLPAAPILLLPPVLIVAGCLWLGHQSSKRKQ